MTSTAPRAVLAARRPFLSLAFLAASSCARPEPPPAPLPPMSWTHLTPLALDVAALEVVPSNPPSPPGDVGPLLSPPPAEAVRGMARDRLSALGGSGQAVFLVTAASLVREPGGALRCSLGCRLDIAGRGGGEEDGPAFAEAAVQRGVSGAEAARPRAADLLLRRAMDDLNVEFEFQLRRNLRRWLASAAPAGAAMPPPVSREELPPQRDGSAGPPGGAAPGRSRPEPEE
jgi:hypothetical protein